MPITYEEARKNPTVHVFRVGQGYMRMARSLPMPANLIGTADKCEPLALANTGTKHVLISAKGPEIVCEWDAGMKVWLPPLEAQGHAMGFTSAYLAAVGWTYKGPVQ